MAPRAVPAESSKSARSRMGKTNGSSAPSVRPAKAATKRPIQSESEDDDEELLAGALEMSDDEEEEGESDNEGEEDFPELDSGSDGDVEDDDEADSDDLADSEADEDEGEDDGSESGYNSSDIEALYDSEDSDDDASTNPITPGSSRVDLTTDEKLSKLIAAHSVKPDDAIGTDAKISRSKDGKGRLVKSKYVDGTFKREYDDVEAGYGSESSTEDVSATRAGRVAADNTEPKHHWQRAYGMV